MENSGKKKFWEQTVPIRQTIEAKTYRCPVCNVVLFSVPVSTSVPAEKNEVTCKNGHRVKVPKYDINQMVHNELTRE